MQYICKLVSCCTIIAKYVRYLALSRACEGVPASWGAHWLGRNGRHGGAIGGYGSSRPRTSISAITMACGAASPVSDAHAIASATVASMPGSSQAE